MKKARVIAIAKDGGSQVIEYGNNHFFMDNSIASKTKGKIFYGIARGGKEVDKDLSSEIKLALKR